ncbi:MAG: PorP/SprF family type IX secretion system membrane protein [Porphyromonadaceae bacterium]|nr:PorP/SprF family type IX secretion system membrane protein [Porphyromonadaceae bacterium]
MGKSRLPFISLLLLCFVLPMQAQWDVPFSHYWAVRSFYNPAFAGATEQIRTVAAYRYEWAGIVNAPQKVALTADLPIEFLRRRQGAGIVFFSEQTGSLRNRLLAGQYSYHREMKNGALQIGLQAGIYSLQFDAGSRKTISGEGYGKPLLQVNPVDKQLPDLHAGIAWSGRQGFAGLSVLHITQPHFYAISDSLTTDLQSDSARTSIPRSINFMAGYNIGLFYPLVLQPMVWVQSSLSETVLQATLRLEYNKRFSGGFSWSPGDGYIIFGGATFQGLEVGYAYNKHTTGVGRVSKGSHELYLRYDLPLDYFKPKLPPQKSIRLL